MKITQITNFEWALVRLQDGGADRPYRLMMEHEAQQWAESQFLDFGLVFKATAAEAMEIAKGWQ